MFLPKGNKDPRLSGHLCLLPIGLQFWLLRPHVLRLS